MCKRCRCNHKLNKCPKDVYVKFVSASALIALPVCSNHPHVSHIIVMYLFMFLDHAYYVLFPIKY